jgi:WD40 repeat protein/serine/threonine protein kinase
MTIPSSDREPLEQLAEEFIERHRRGEKPSLDDYVARYPQWADSIRALFPTLLEMEQLASVDGQATGPHGARPLDPGTLPERLGEYRILREIGHGGMGIVYEAVQESLGRHVALKVLPLHGLLNPTLLERFKREARAAAKLHHTNIVPVFGVGEDGGIHYFAMQYISGQGLDKVLDEVRRLRAGTKTADSAPEQPGEVQSGSVAPALISGSFGGHEPSTAGTALAAAPEVEGSRLASTPADGFSLTEGEYYRSVARAGVQVAEALAYAHRQGVLHRDVKPSNLLLDTRGTVWITDFGLAKMDDSDNLTDTGDVVGTLRYLAPERLEGRGDVRSEVYGVGVTLYEMLTLRPAFPETDRLALLQQVRSGEPPRPRQLKPEVPRDLETIVLKAMAKEPARRYQTALDLADELQRWLKNEPIQARPVGVLERTWRWAKRRPAVAALIGVSVMAVLALLIVGLLYDARLGSLIREADREHQEAAKANLEAQDFRKKARYNLYVGNLKLAEHEWLTNNLARVRLLLREAPEEFRGWEWRYLNRVCDAELARLTGHRRFVRGVAYSPDGKWIVSASYDRTIKIWDARTDKEVKSFTHNDELDSVTFSPNGKLLASVGCSDEKKEPGDLKLWDTISWEEVHPLQGLPAKVWAAAFSPEGRYLALASGLPQASGIVTIWDLETGREVRQLSGHTGPVVSLSFSPDGQRLASLAVAGAEMIIHEVSTGKPLLSLPMPSFSGAWARVVFSPDGRHVAWMYRFDTVRIADSRNGQEICSLQGHTDWITDLAYSPDGKLLATASRDGQCKLWDPVVGEEVRTLRGSSGILCAVAFSPDGQRLAAGSVDGVILWDPNIGHDPLTLHGSLGPAQLCKVAVSSDGKKIATGGVHRNVLVWDPATGQQLLALRGHDSMVGWGLAFDPSGRLLATADGKIRLWDVTTGQLLRTLEASQERFLWVAFSPDGQRLATSFVNPKATGAARSGIKLWSVSPGPEPLTLLGHDGGVRSVAYSPDGERLVSSCNDRTARVWDARTGQQLLCLHGHTNYLYDACFSPDGRYIATCSIDRTAKIWDAASGKELFSLEGHTSDVTCVAFSPDSQRLASASWDQTVKLWDVATGQELLSLRGHQRRVFGVAFSPDSQWLASVGDDGALRLWEAMPLTPEGRLQREAVTLVNRLAVEVGLKEEMLTQLRSNSLLGASLRQQALLLAEHHREDPVDLNLAAIRIVNQPGLNPARYKLALQQAQAALQFASPEFRFNGGDRPRTVFGIAQFRLGRYRDALESLQHAQDEHKVLAKLSPQVLGVPGSKEWPPWNYAVMAMANFQLGDKEQARLLLERTREVMKNAFWGAHPVAPGYLHEAEALIEGNAPGPKK